MASSIAAPVVTSLVLSRAPWREVKACQLSQGFFVSGCWVWGDWGNGPTGKRDRGG